MTSGLSLQRLNLLVFDNALLEPVDIKTLQDGLKNPATQVQAMRTAISMIQQGYDLGMISSDVLKVFDTTDPKLKLLCNLYLRRCCMDRPACQLMCTHTFLKDFNDRNWAIQRCATDDAVELGDEILIKNYVYDLKRMSMHGQHEVRRGVARALGIFHRKSRQLFLEHGLGKILRKLAADPDESVSVAALRAIADVERLEKANCSLDTATPSPAAILTTSELITALENAHQGVRIHRTRGLLGVLKNRQLDELHAPVLRRLMASADVSVFYLASRKLLEISNSDLPEIFEQACGFLSLRDEQLYNILLFIETFVHRIECDRLPFAIHSNDPEYIVRAKIRIIFQMRTTPIAQHLKECTANQKYNMQILEMCLRHGVIIDDLLLYIASAQLGAFLERLLRFRKISDGWTSRIADYICNGICIKSSGEVGLVGHNDSQARDTHPGAQACVPRRQTAILALEAAGRYADQMPGWASNLQQNLYPNELVRLFCRLAQRGVIDLEQCLSYLKDLQLKAPTCRRVKFIISHIGRVATEGLHMLVQECKLEYTRPQVPVLPETLLDFQNATAGHAVACNERVLLSKPYASGCPRPEKISTAPSSIKPSDGIEIVQRLPLYISTSTYKGCLDIVDDNLVLRTENIGDCTTIVCGICSISNTALLGRSEPRAADQAGDKGDGTAECFAAAPSPTHGAAQCTSGPASPCESQVSIVVQHAGECNIFTAKPEHIGRALKFVVDGRIYFIVLGLPQLITPLVCEEAFHERQFGELEKYAVVDTFNLENVYIVNDTLFSFSLLGHSVYGKSFSSQIVLKSDSEILCALQQAGSRPCGE